MDFKQLHSFISVVRCRSFTEAAEELGISQPTISTHIRILEEELIHGSSYAQPKALKSPLEAWNFLNVPKTF